MALTVTSRGTGTHNTGATTLVPGGRSATLAVGSLGVLCMALDNAGPPAPSPDRPRLLDRRQGQRLDPAAERAVRQRCRLGRHRDGAIYTAPITVALLTTDAGTMTVEDGRLAGREGVDLVRGHPVGQRGGRST